VADKILPQLTHFSQLEKKELSWHATFDFFFIPGAIESISFKPFIGALLVPITTNKMVFVFFHNVIVSYGELKIKKYL